MNKFFNAAKTGDTLTLSFYDAIGESLFGEGATPSMVASALKGGCKNIEIHLNSPGGDAFAGVAIYNLLKASSKPVNVVVDGMAASAASIIAMAGDTITMATGSVMMIHEAMSMGFGNAGDLNKLAETLTTVTSGIADIYVARTGKDKADVLNLLNAETWMTADEAVAEGFATSVNTAKSAVTNTFDLTKFRNAPKAVSNSTCLCDCPECASGNCADCSNPDCDDPSCDSQMDNKVVEAVVNDAPDLSLYLHRLEMNKRK